MEFYKYHGTGNDFIMIDGFKHIDIKSSFTRSLVSDMCRRHFGIGADGLIILNPSETSDFEMVYYNSDGNESTMCGNGGRCLLQFAYDLGYIKENAVFEAIDGMHEGKISEDLVELKMIDVQEIEHIGNDLLINTGSPHYIKFVDDPASINIIEDAHAIRYNDRFNSEGVNVNFISNTIQPLKVRTYERGVEDETLSCGTGVVAASIASQIYHSHDKGEVKISAIGGELSVRYTQQNNSFVDIWLTGPAKFVFKGDWMI